MTPRSPDAELSGGPWYPELLPHLHHKQQILADPRLLHLQRYPVQQSLKRYPFFLPIDPIRKASMGFSSVG